MEEQKQTFEASAAFKYGWQIFKENAGLLIGILVLGYVIMIGASMAMAIVALMLTGGEAVTETSPLWIRAFIFIPNWLVQFIIQIGWINVALKFANREKVGVADLFRKWKLIGHYLLASFLAMLIIGAGFIALIVPGIYLATRLCLVNYFVVDQNLNAFEAIKASFRATKGNFWNLILFFILAVLVNIGGAFALIVGLVVTVPISMIAFVVVYKSLSGQKLPGMTPTNTAQPAAS